MVIFWRDVTRIGGRCKVEEEVGEEDSHCSFDPKASAHERQCSRNEHDLRDRQQKDEEYLNGSVSLYLL